MTFGAVPFEIRPELGTGIGDEIEPEPAGSLYRAEVQVFSRSGYHWRDRKAAPYALPRRHVDSVSPPRRRHGARLMEVILSTC